MPQWSRALPIVAFVAGLAAWSPSSASAATIGVSEVPLNGVFDDIRRFETNLGNLVADSVFWQVSEGSFSPTIAVVNGGGIRTNELSFPGATPATPADIDDPAFTVDALPFGNTLVVLQDVTVGTLLSALEHSVAQALDVAPGGRFLQIAGFQFSWNTSAPVGSRIIDVKLGNGTMLVDDGAVVSSLLIRIATNLFVAGGGDDYTMFTGLVAADTGFIDEQALSDFISTGLSGRVRLGDYPLGGNDRIFRNAQLAPGTVPEPASLTLVAIGLAGFGWRRRARKTT